MAKYDDASWHYEGDYPEDLPEENAATHIGMFVAWCIENNLVADELAEDCSDDIQKVLRHEMTGGEFLLMNCDGKFIDDDLSETGNAFANDYYEGNTTFTKKHPKYGYDYQETFDKKAADSGFAYETIYHVEDTWENYKLLKTVIDTRYKEWEIYNKPQKTRRRWPWQSA